MSKQSALGSWVTAHSGQTRPGMLGSQASVPYLGLQAAQASTGTSGLDAGERPDPSVLASLVQAALSHHEEAPEQAICYLVSKSQFCPLLAV